MCSVKQGEDMTDINEYLQEEWNLGFMQRHPLRDTLKQEDWIRIHSALNGEHDNVSLEEIDAAQDVFYDMIAGRDQTHLGILTLQ
jgi:hypothetical protein